MYVELATAAVAGVSPQVEMIKGCSKVLPDVRVKVNKE